MRRGLRLTVEKRPRQNEVAKRNLMFQLRGVGLQDFVSEYRFATEIDRELRWDIAYVDMGLAIEVNGGIWTKGAHGHPITILRNMEKLTVGAFLGWGVFQFSTDEVKTGRALQVIEAFFKKGRGENIDVKKLFPTPSENPRRSRRVSRASARPK